MDWAADDCPAHYHHATYYHLAHYHPIHYYQGHYYHSAVAVLALRLVVEVVMTHLVPDPEVAVEPRCLSAQAQTLPRPGSHRTQLYWSYRHRQTNQFAQQLLVPEERCFLKQPCYSMKDHCHHLRQYRRHLVGRHCPS